MHVKSDEAQRPSVCVVLFGEGGANLGVALVIDRSSEIGDQTKGIRITLMLKKVPATVLLHKFFSHDKEQTRPISKPVMHCTTRSTL
ncbi:hypothetical protein TNCV_1472471 [Trichonephila clavipes]|nr:hypothetical protein TNCV_1472471 [Trichonephila clavipes]